ncbi:MAG: recombination protein RecR, partial [Proteobacteria bacterium]|nr:recombination protein RecR [Pseudomonadota bacterium]
MAAKTQGPEIERLIQLLARLPGLGARSARKAALALLKRRTDLLEPLSKAMAEAAAKLSSCPECGNLDTVVPCSICRDEGRDQSLIVVVEEIGDLWALERAGVVRGRYHVLGGHLSPLDGIGPEQLNIGRLIERAKDPVREVLLALNATVEG